MIKVDFVTHQPLKIGSPTIKNISNKTYTVVLSDEEQKHSSITVDLQPGQQYSSPYQYYIKWKIELWDVDERLKSLFGEVKVPISSYTLDLQGKIVFIKMDAYALGDNLAWMPYIEEFSNKHNCKVVCSTFWNDLFVNEYPNILFVKPNTRIENVFAQYYIGTHDDTPPMYSPSTYITEPLQKVASDILGLEYKPLTARVSHIPIERNPKKVCLSQYASLDMKTWHGDWQKVVDLLVEKGYEVHVISKEPNKLQNVIDKSGDRPIEERIQDLASSAYFVGVSSGLTWLAHSLGAHVFLISDFTPKNHEFQDNVTRIYGKNVRTSIEYAPIKNEVSTKDVVYQIKQKLAK